MASRVLLKELQSIERKRTFFFRQLKQHFLFKMTIAFIRKYYLFEATNLKRLDSKFSLFESFRSTRRERSVRNDLSSPDLPLYTNRNRVGEVERKRPNSTDLTKTDISIASEQSRIPRESKIRSYSRNSTRFSNSERTLFSSSNYRFDKHIDP